MSVEKQRVPGDRNEQKGFKGMIVSLDEKYGILRAIKFGIAGIIGFLVSEAILTSGVLILYHEASVPSGDYSSVPLIILNIIAFGTGVTAGFFVNELITVKNENEPRGRKNVLRRLLKFQLAYVAGNVITILVQLALLAIFGLTPILGNIIGAILAFPFSYVVSMRFVWKIKAAKTEKVQGQGKESEAGVPK